MFAVVTPVPNWTYASPLELIVWAIAMSLAALLGISLFIALTQDAPNRHGQEFRCTFLFVATFSLLIVGTLVATRGHATASNAATQHVEQERCGQAERDRLRSMP